MPVTILVADDSATMRRILEMTFAGEDARVVAVDSGAAAIERAADLRPDVVFADVSMDGADAYEVCRAIKTSPSTASTCVIVLASQLHPYDDTKGRAAGVDDHVLKPFDTQVVISRVAQVLSRPRNVPQGAAPAHPYRDGAPIAAAAPPAPAPVISSGPVAAPKAVPRTATVAFGSSPIAAKPPAPPAPPPVARPPAASAAPVAAAKPQVAAKPAGKPSLEIVDDLLADTASAVPGHAAAATAAASATSGGGEMAERLAGLGLTAEQVEGVLRISRDVIERVAWEVVPDLAEAIIKDEIRRLTSG